MRTKFVTALRRAVRDAMHNPQTGVEKLTGMQYDAMRFGIEKAVIEVVRNEYGSANPNLSKTAETS